MLIHETISPIQASLQYTYIFCYIKLFIFMYSKILNYNAFLLITSLVFLAANVTSFGNYQPAKIPTKFNKKPTNYCINIDRWDIMQGWLISLYYLYYHYDIFCCLLRINSRLFQIFHFYLLKKNLGRSFYLKFIYLLSHRTVCKLPLILDPKMRIWLFICSGWLVWDHFKAVFQKAHDVPMRKCKYFDVSTHTRPLIVCGRWWTNQVRTLRFRKKSHILYSCLFYIFV